MQQRLLTPPPSSQMAAIHDKLELLCWRTVPTFLRAQLLGAQMAGSEELDESALITRRFIALTRAIDSMFGKKIATIGEERRIASWGLETCLASLLDALPPFFTRNADFWPTEVFLKTLLTANSMRRFSESTELMSLVRNVLNVVY